MKTDQMNIEWCEYGEPIVIKRSTFEELREVASLLYFEVKIRHTPVAFPLNADERLLFETVNRLNDVEDAVMYLFMKFIGSTYNCCIKVYDSKTKTYNTPVPSELEAADFNMKAPLCIEVSSKTGKLSHFSVDVNQSHCLGEFRVILVIMLLQDSGIFVHNVCTVLQKNPLSMTADQFSQYVRYLWSHFESKFNTPIFLQIYHDKPITWSSYESVDDSR